jgi:glycosyltransferase involved in cell wall biosynthesis
MKIRIAHIITGLGTGGAELSLVKLLLNRKEQDIEHTVICLGPESTKVYDLRQAGIKTLCLDMKGVCIQSIFSFFKSLVFLIRLNPSIIQGWMFHGNFAATLYYLGCGCKGKLGWNIRQSLDALSQFKMLTRGLIYFSFLFSWLPSFIIFNSKKSLEQHVEKGFPVSRCQFIPNGFKKVSAANARRARNEVRSLLGSDDEAFIIGFVGRDHPQKNLKSLLTAFTVLAESYPDIQLYCIGVSSEGYQDQQLSSRIVFLGERADASYLMCSFDVLCLPSFMEGFPNVVGEAMSCGVPVIASDVGDNSIILDNCGWIFDPNERLALTRVLEMVINLPRTALRNKGALAMRRINKKYTESAVLDLYGETYRRMVWN